MKEKTDFLISYEHKARELDTIVLLKQELEKRGYTVRIHCSYENDVFKYPQFSKVKAKCVIVPAAYDIDVIDYFSFSIVGLVKKIINLQWEQVLSIEEESDKNGYHNPKGIARNIVHLCWGEASQRRLMVSGVPKSRCVVTGPGHMDILRKPYSKKILNKDVLSENFCIDSHKKWILFISSFSLNDLDVQNKEYIRNSMGIEYFDSFYNFSVKSREEILKWFDYYLLENSNSIIIYRPHPDEVNKNNELKKLEKKHENFKVISDLVITHWINSADIILNWYSTAKAYVVFQNKFEYVLRPIPIEKKYEVSIMNGDSFVTTYEEFFDVVTNDKRESYPMRDISDYYDFDKEVPTYKRIADMCEQILKSKKYDVFIPLRYKAHFFIRMLKNIAFLFLSKKKSNNVYVKRTIEKRKELELYLSNGYARNVATEEDIKNILDF